MSSPFALALQTNPDQFLAELDTPELEALMIASVSVLEKRAKTGDAAVAPALQAIYRVLGDIEV